MGNIWGKVKGIFNDYIFITFPKKTSANKEGIMPNGDMSQEEYFSGTGLGTICIRGVKKLVTELTSVKTLAMIAFVGLTAFGKMGDMACVAGLLGCIGAKEVDFSQVVEIVKTRLGK